MILVQFVIFLLYKYPIYFSPDCILMPNMDDPDTWCKIVGLLVYFADSMQGKENSWIGSYAFDVVELNVNRSCNATQIKF